MSLVIKPQGALALGYRPVSPPDLRTAYSPRSMPIPLPTTVLGALGRALNVALNSANRDWGLGELLDGISDKLGCKPRLWGPLVRAVANRGRETYVPVGGSMVRISRAPRAVESVIKRWAGLEEVEKRAVSRPWVESRVGVMLNPHRRTVERGYIYSVEYLTPVRGERTEYVYHVGCNLEGFRSLVRFGGESRLAVLEGSGRELAEPAPSRVYVLLSHAVLPKTRVIEAGELMPTPGQAKVEYVFGRAEPIALGYSQVAGVRRPVRFSLSPGTVVVLDRKGPARAWLGELTDYGFGAMLPVEVDVSGLV